MLLALHRAQCWRRSKELAGGAACDRCAGQQRLRLGGGPFTALLAAGAADGLFGGGSGHLHGELFAADLGDLQAARLVQVILHAVGEADFGN